MSKKMNRRSFFAKTVVASGAAAGLGYSFEEKALLARQALAAPPSEKEDPIKGLPKGKIGDIEISRVILGSNLFVGGAHARNLKYVSELMSRYMTVEKVMETLQLCEENGINTNVGHVGSEGKSESDTAGLHKYNRERGGKIQLLAELDPYNYSFRDDDNPDGSITITKKEITGIVEAAVKEGAVGAFLLGCIGDRWVKVNRMDLIEEFVSCVKKTGMIAGVGGHDKRVPVAVEKAGIDVDFYFKTIHPDTYWGTVPEEEKVPFLVDSFGSVEGEDNDCMWELHPQDTIDNMKPIKKPWIGYKVLAAGAVPPTEAFQFAFENGADFICAGMFDWQVREDVGIAKKVLASDEVKNRARPWTA
jgi:hypothetical protein